VGTGQKPQVNWTMGESLSKVPSARTNALSVGVQFSWQLYDGGSNAAATRAALKRADASRQSYQEALSSRIAKVNEQHDGAVSAFERARRYAEVMRDSERVRNFTFQQWSQLGRRSLFDVMSAESDHFAQRVGYINALVDGAQANASLRSQGVGLLRWLGAQP
jgi:adhesin transport system outer membrane protein